MAKSRSEIQKAYREQKKANDPEFLQRERLRQKSYNVPAAALSKKKLTEQNLKNKFRNRLSRLRPREMQQNDNQTHDDTSGYESGLDQSTEEMNAKYTAATTQFPWAIKTDCKNADCENQKR